VLCLVISSVILNSVGSQYGFLNCFQDNRFGVLFIQLIRMILVPVFGPGQLLTPAKAHLRGGPGVVRASQLHNATLPVPLFSYELVDLVVQVS